MARDQNILELVSIGPFSGVDTTTDAFSLAPTCFRDALNFAPNANYGGLQTVKGRQKLTDIATLMGFSGVCTGMEIFHRDNQPEVFLFAITVNNQGYLIATDDAGHPLTLTNVPTNITPNRPTFFALANKWCFVTNGVDTPIKIDQDLNVTLWGIAAPTSKPAPVAGPPGLLSGKYWYCCTFGNADQESSQGVISDPITVEKIAASMAGASNVPTLQITGSTPTAGDVVQLTVQTSTGSFTLTSAPAASGDSAMKVAVAFLIQIQSELTGLLTVESNVVNALGTVGFQYLFTADVPGTDGNNISVALSTTNVNGGSSGLIPLGGVVNLSGGTDGAVINIGNIPQPDDPQVTEVNLYRIGGSLGQWRLIKNMPLGVLTYTDGLPDSNITGQSLTIFRDPPQKFTHICAHQGRIFGFGTPDDPSVLWFSNYNEPWGFDPSSNTRAVGENTFGDGAVVMGSLGSTLLLLKRRSAYSLVGSTDADFTVYPLFEIGCASAFSLAILEGTAFWLSNQSVWAYNGYSRQNISDGSYQKSNIKAILDEMNPTERAQACGFIYDHAYYLSLPSRNTTYLFDSVGQSWWPIGMVAAAACADLEDPDHDPTVIGVGSDGTIATWFATANDLESDLVAYLVSGIQDSGDMRSTKTYDYVRLRAPIQQIGTKAKVSVFVNPDSPTQTFDSQDIALDGTLGGGYVTQQIHLAMLKGYCAQVRLDVHATTQPVQISKLVVYGMIDREMGELG